MEPIVVQLRSLVLGEPEAVGLVEALRILRTMDRTAARPRRRPAGRGRARAGG